MSGEMVGQPVDRVLNGVSVPRSITVGHRPSFIASPRRLGISSGCTARLYSTESRGKCLYQSLNGRLRDECLNTHQFASLAEAQTIDAQRLDYNQHRSHSSLGHLPPQAILLHNVRFSGLPKSPLHWVQSCLRMRPKSPCLLPHLGS